jgi:3-carboxy-cis,cis-muconate cycloisomerase
MLVAGRAWTPIDAALGRAAAACAGLARAHADLVMAGRTLLQQALPISFGLKAAGWLAGLDDARGQLELARSRLAVQLGGAAGTLASLGSAGPAVLRAFAARLDLAEPVLPWHTARQRVSGLAGALGTVAGTAGKICTDVVLLAQNEVGEMTEAAAGGSSALPQKRNPATAVSVLAASRRALALVPVLQAALIAEHERAIGGWQSEWDSLSQLLTLAGGAAAGAARVVVSLEVHPPAMAANLEASGGLLLAERVVFTVAAATGNQAEARLAVNQAVEACARQPIGFAGALARDPLVSSVLSPTQIDELLDPAGYLGASNIWIERALAAHDRESHRDAGPATQPL